MKRHRYATGNYKAPVSITWLTFLTLDIYNAPGWLWGSLGVLFVITWAAFIALGWKQEPVDLSSLPTVKESEEREKEKDPPFGKKSKFMEKLDAAIKRKSEAK